MICCRQFFRNSEWLAFVLGALVFAYQFFTTSDLNFIPSMPDSVEYENIGFQLYKHGRYGVDWDDPEWREPFNITANVPPGVAAMLTRSGGYHPSSLRPPIYPIFIAAVYHVFERSFVALRIANFFLILASFYLILQMANKLCGISGIIGSTLAFMLDQEKVRYADFILTEATAFFLVTLLLWQLTSARWSEKPRDYAILGLILALLCLVRSAFLVWTPLVILAATLAGAKCNKSKYKMIIAACFVCFLVQAPWWARNSIHLKSFSPLGVEIWHSLPGAYSGEVQQTKGLWDGSHIGFKDNQQKAIAAIKMVGSEAFETNASNEKNRRWMIDWLKNNYSTVPALFFTKIIGGFFVHISPSQKVLICLAVYGVLFAVLHYRLYWSLLLVLVATCITLGLTWVAPGGRYIFPTHPALYMFAGLSVTGLLTLYRLRTQPRTSSVASDTTTD